MHFFAVLAEELDLELGRDSSLSARLGAGAEEDRIEGQGQQAHPHISDLPHAQGGKTRCMCAGAETEKELKRDGVSERIEQSELEREWMGGERGQERGREIMGDREGVRESRPS